jgi:hypothetical protein
MLRSKVNCTVEDVVGKGEFGFGSIIEEEIERGMEEQDHEIDVGNTKSHSVENWL